jgi:peptide-methionine (S)-S-oxide reductase
MSAAMACNTVKSSTENAVAMPAATPDRTATALVKGEQTAVFAGGCFWGVEAVFEHVRGVIDARSGYSGGTKATADYDTVSEGKTGHAESVKVTYDPTKVTYEQLLTVFFSVAHDPTQLNYQGPDHGTQYRSVVFYMDDDQRRAVIAYIDKIRQAKMYPNPVVTQVVPFEAFYDAEAYHQDYMKHHPDDQYIVYNDAPKVASLKDKFPDLYLDK